MQENTLKDPSCVSAAVAILGDKWIPLLIRALATDTMRFCQLQEVVGGVNPRTLSAKLAYLEAENIITKKVFSEKPPRTHYQLTDKGRDLVPILTSMAAWSSRHGKPVEVGLRSARG